MKKKNNIILVTGGTGSFGKNFVKYLNEKRYLVIIISNQAAVGKLLISE